MESSNATEPVPANEIEPEGDDFSEVPTYEVEPPEELPLGQQRLRVEWLETAQRNPRRGSVRDVVESLREFGQHRPVVVQQSTRQVIVGNHLLMAARTLGWEEIDAFVVDDDDDKALRRAIADNAVGDKAGWDDEELALVLKDIGPVPGFDEAEIEKALKVLGTEEVEVAEPTYPLVPRLNEHYDYVMIFCETETDWVWLQTRLQLRREKSYKSSAVATSHVLTVSRFQELIGE